MAIFPPSSSLLYLLGSQNKVQLYLEILKEKKAFQTHLSFTSELMCWQGWTEASLAGPAVSQSCSKHSCRAELWKKRGIKTAIHLRNDFPQCHVPFLPCSNLYSTLLSLWLESDYLRSPGLITLHFPTINCISHLSACNPNKSKSFWMSLFCSSVPSFCPSSFLSLILCHHHIWGTFEITCCSRAQHWI